MTDINPLTVGPIGHAGFNSVRIWGRSDYEPLASGLPRRSFGVARIKASIGGRYGTPVIFKMNPNFDMSGVAIFSDLAPDTEYSYQMGWFFSDKELDDFKVLSS
jgi:alkaline phosphatase D